MTVSRNSAVSPPWNWGSSEWIAGLRGILARPWKSSSCLGSMAEKLDVSESAGVYETQDSAVRSDDFRCW